MIETAHYTTLDGWLETKVQPVQVEAIKVKINDISTYVAEHDDRIEICVRDKYNEVLHSYIYIYPFPKESEVGMCPGGPFTFIAAGVTKPSNPKDRAATNRLDLTLFPQSAVIYGALAMTEGDCKYGGYNYRSAGVNLSVYVAALLRHVYKAYNGEWADPVTKVPHFANAIACLAVLIDGYEQGNIKDDRPPRQDVAKLLTESEEIVQHLNTLYPNGPSRFTHIQE